jgi:ribosomal protein S18 acetylase RimI-like enzyme
MTEPVAVCIAPLRAADLAELTALARRVWQATYPALISQAQIDFMLADRYASARIAAQLTDPEHAWLVARVGDTLAGFAHLDGSGEVAKLDKLYVDPAWHGRGVGRELFDCVLSLARMTLAPALRLQVNRGNVRAVAAYQKWGFVVVEEKVFAIGKGFVMDDYVMEYAL